MIYLIQGEDEFLRTEALAALRAALGPDETTAAMNTTRFDGATLSLGELQAAAGAMPFLAERRLVIVEGFNQQIDGRKPREAAAAILEYLAVVPETTDLVFVEPSAPKAAGPLVSAVQRAGGKLIAATAPRADSPQLVAWIRSRARAHALRLRDDRVAQELSAYVGNDLRTLDNELEKLALYAGDRPATVEDVHRLVPQVREQIIFDLVDALGGGQPRQALRLARGLIDEQREAPLYVLTMIVRQFRLLLQVKELLQRGLTPPRIAAELKLHPFVAEKLARQARAFPLDELRAAFLRLARLDAGIKHGDIQSPEAAIDAFIVEVARR